MFYFINYYLLPFLSIKKLAFNFHQFNINTIQKFNSAITISQYINEASMKANNDDNSQIKVNKNQKSKQVAKSVQKKVTKKKSQSNGSYLQQELFFFYV